MSQQFGTKDGFSFCKQRLYTLVNSATQQTPSFVSITGSQITLNPTAASDKGVITFELWTSLGLYPKVSSLKLTQFLIVTLLDCAYAKISALT